ncbi:MAG TPA: sigma-70 family RNA polymerase sigma factor [Thermoanaerobaculia bacterium]
MADEQAHIEAAKTDPSRFAELYEDNFERVYAFIIRRVHDRHDAEDLTSEVFQNALANLSKFEWRGAPFAAWLYRIAANAVADHFRRTSREASGAAVEQMAAEDYEEIERRGRLFKSVDRLPADQRRVIVSRFGEGKSIREVAAEMNRSEGAVKQLQWRGLQSLRAQIEKIHG